MGYVPQDQFLFATSILDNIRFGNPNLSLSAVVEATKLARVYQDIVDMPQGFDTLRHEDLLALDGWYAQTYQSQQLEMKGEEDAE
ncbi:ABC transporter ATP-binding protein/permease [Streptococcus pneumoniae]|nr:ABC transporter ATP-binding protein/permease [Streptococcus pneumoniae]